MYEVHSGHTPGRKNLAVVLSGAVLIGTLSIAWLQGRSHRTLGEPVALDGTNLTVRLPKGWLEDPPNSGTFVLPADPGPNGARPGLPSRQIRITALQRAFKSPYPAQTVLSGRGENGQLRDGRVTRIDSIAGMRAVEQLWDTVLHIQVPGGVRRLEQTIIVREAASLRGDFISIKYQALSDLGAGDRLMLDAICAGIRDEAPERDVDPAQAMARIGVEFELEPGWTVADPNPPELAGLYVGPALDGTAFWSVAVFRTQFEPGDLQSALAGLMGRRGIKLGVPDSLQFTGPLRIGDNEAVGVSYRGNNQKHAIPIGSLWIVSASETETVVILSLARHSNVDLAERAAARIAKTIRFVADQTVSPVSKKELVSRFARGARP